MLARLLSLTTALVLACASAHTHANARLPQPETAHRAFATIEETASRAEALLIASDIKANCHRQRECTTAHDVYANNSPYKFTDPDGRESVGEMIDSGAEGCGAVTCAGWAATKAVWGVFGAEGVSQVYDKGSDASTFDKGMAAVEVGTLGIGGKVGAVLKATGLTKLVQVSRAESLIGQIPTLGALGSKGIREVVGTAKDAKKMFDTLRAGNKVKEVAPGVLTAAGAKGGTVTFRAASKSGPPTVDVHGVVADVRKIKFLEPQP